MTNRQTLAVLLNEGLREKFQITGFATSIGRSAGNDYVLNKDSLASRQHAFILFHDGTFSIQDLGSKNGTFVNGQKLEFGQMLKIRSGDEIVVGTTRMSFVDLSVRSPDGSVPTIDKTLANDQSELQVVQRQTLSSAKPF